MAETWFDYKSYAYSRAECRLGISKFRLPSCLNSQPSVYISEKSCHKFWLNSKPSRVSVFDSSDAIKHVDKVFCLCCCMLHALSSQTGLSDSRSSTRRHFPNWSKSHSISIDIRYLIDSASFEIINMFSHDQLTVTTSCDETASWENAKQQSFVRLTSFGKRDKRWKLVTCQSSARLRLRSTYISF